MRNFRIFLAFFTIINAWVFSQQQSEQEMLFIRRIVEFFRDEEFPIVVSQVEEFLQQYPESAYRDKLSLILGDLYFREGEYDRALSIYDSIKSEELHNQTLINRLHSLYKLKQYPTLVEETSSALTGDDQDIIDEELRQLVTFYYAEGLFRQVLQNQDPKEKKAIYSCIKPYYQKLLDTSYNDHAKQALVEIYRELEDFENAARLFIELANEHPENRENLLFNAATMQSFFDKDQAFDTFITVQNMDGEKKRDAAFNWMMLFFEMERFQDLVDAKEELLPLIPDD